MKMRFVLPLVFLLGLWSGCTVFMWQVAIQNFAVAESVASSGNVGLRTAVGELSQGSLRAAVRYQASEVNRLFFTRWGWIQIPLAAGVLLLAWFSGTGRTVVVLIGAMLAIAILLAGYVAPETAVLGRMMDFAPETDLPNVRSRFWTLHHAYTALDMAKFVLGLGAVVLAMRARRRGSTAS